MGGPGVPCRTQCLSILCHHPNVGRRSCQKAEGVRMSCHGVERGVFCDSDVFPHHCTSIIGTSKQAVAAEVRSKRSTPEIMIMHSVTSKRIKTPRVLVNQMSLRVESNKQESVRNRNSCVRGTPQAEQVPSTARHLQLNKTHSFPGGPSALALRIALVPPAALLAGAHLAASTKHQASESWFAAAF